MLKQWINLLKTDRDTDPWLKEKAFTSGSAIGTVSALPHKASSHRRSAYSLGLRAMAFVTLGIFAMNTAPARLIAEAANLNWAGSTTASALNANPDGSDEINLTNDATLTLDQDITVNKVYLDNHSLTIEGPGSLIVNHTNTSSGIRKNDSGSLIINSGSVKVTNSNAGDTEPAIYVDDLTVATGADLEVHAAGTTVNVVTICGAFNIGANSIVIPNGGFAAKSTDFTANGPDWYIYDSNNQSAKHLKISYLGGGGGNGDDGNKKDTTPPADKTDDDPNKKSHVHNYQWKTILEPTETQDGTEALICDCGSILTQLPLTGMGVFCRNAAEMIQKADKNGVVVISTKNWISFNHIVRDAMLKRPDVTLRITFLDEGHRGTQRTVTIPAGCDVSSLFDQSGFMGFLNAGAVFGYN